LERFSDNPAAYGRAALLAGYAPCEENVVKMLQVLLSNRLRLAETNDGELFLDAEINARVVKDSEQYYRAMYYADQLSWNLRDSHMFSVLRRLLKTRPGSKAVVWAHNSHVGDARYTSMGEVRGELNIGQLCKQKLSTSPDDVVIIGCSTHGGEDSTVACADNWDEPMRTKTVNPSREDSYEYIMHNTGIQSFLLDLRDRPENADVRKALMKPRLERFIGVIYRPDSERLSHYSTAVLPRQLDALVWFDQTRAVKAFEMAQPKEELSVEETYPFGL
jgi:erythromycin esterase-like protein